MSDLSEATRELFIRSVKDQVFMTIPILEELMRRSKVTYSGGTNIERLVDTDEMDDLGQPYTANEPLTDGKKDVLDKPSFSWKYYQHPMKYDVDEYLQNHTASAKEIKLLDLADFLVRKSQRGIRIALRNMMYNVDPQTRVGNETGVGDSTKKFQSLLSALDHDVTTYGTISRAVAGSNTWWLGADPEGRVDQISSSSQNTAYNISVSNIRKWIVPIEQYAEKSSDLYIVMCPTLWNTVRAELEAKGTVTLNKDKMRYGIQSFMLDGMEIVKDPYLEHGYGTSGTTENWVFILNLSDWELRIHTDRNFKQTDFVWQGDQANGYDHWLARIMLAGNLMCWKPNGSMWLMNVS